MYRMSSRCGVCFMLLSLVRFAESQTLYSAIRDEEGPELQALKTNVKDLKEELRVIKGRANVWGIDWVYNLSALMKSSLKKKIANCWDCSELRSFESREEKINNSYTHRFAKFLFCECFRRMLISRYISQLIWNNTCTKGFYNERFGKI